MAKQNLSTDTSGLYEQLELCTKRINFLINSRKDLIQNSMLSASVERDFIDNGFAELFEEIKKSTHNAIISLLDSQITVEEKKVKILFEKINK